MEMHDKVRMAGDLRLTGFLPDHYVKVYEHWEKLTKLIHSNNTVNRRDREIVVLLAEELHERDLRIADLEQRIVALEPKKPVVAKTESVGDGGEVVDVGKVDFRTKAGRELKNKLETAGV